MEFDELCQSWNFFEDFTQYGVYIDNVKKSMIIPDHKRSRAS